MATLNAEHINPFLMAAKKVLQDMCCRCCNTKADTEGSKI